MKIKKYISLGEDCLPRSSATFYGLKAKKADGELSLPFDLMITGLEDCIKCIKSDFLDMVNSDYLNFEEHPKFIGHGKFITHKKYKSFIFNHESESTCISFSLDGNHFTNNNYQKFIERYKARIDNFYKYVQNENHVLIFLVHSSDMKSITELLNILEEKIGKKVRIISFSKKDGNNKIIPSYGLRTVHFQYTIKGEWNTVDNLMQIGKQISDATDYLMCQTDINLVHFGTHCGPTSLINDILNYHRKQLFMLGAFPLDGIKKMITESNYEEIYNIEHLEYESKRLEIDYDQNIEKYCHTYPVYHKLFGFYLNHDFNISDNKIVNYDFIKNSYINKIKCFKKIIANDDDTFFITITPDQLTADLFINLKENQYHLIYSNNNNNCELGPNRFFFKLKNDITNWYEKKPEDRLDLYREIYDNFYKTLSKIDVTVPKFEETFYFTKYHT